MPANPPRTADEVIADQAHRIRKLEQRNRADLQGGGRGSGGRPASLVIAAADAPEQWKAQADLVCEGGPGNGADNAAINQAIRDLTDAGLLMYGVDMLLSPGTFWFSASGMTANGNAVDLPIGSAVRGVSKNGWWLPTSTSELPDLIDLSSVVSTTILCDYTGTFYTGFGDVSNGNQLFEDFNMIAHAGGVTPSDPINDTELNAIDCGFSVANRVFVYGFSTGIEIGGRTVTDCYASNCFTGFFSAGNGADFYSGCFARNCGYGYQLSGAAPQAVGCMASVCGIGYRLSSGAPVLSGCSAFDGEPDNEPFSLGGLGGAGIWADSSNGATINGCLITQRNVAAIEYGMFVQGDNSSIVGNTINRTGVGGAAFTYGINIAVGGTNNMVEANNCRGNTNPITNNGGATNQVGTSNKTT